MDPVDKAVDEMLRRTPSSKMTAEEIVYARALDKLAVDKDGLATVPTAWLENWRARTGRDPSPPTSKKP